MNKTFFQWKILLGAAAVALISSSSAVAQTWTAADGGNWADPTNWNAEVPNTAGATASLTEDLTGQNGSNVDLQGGTYTVGTLNIGSTTGNGYFYLNDGFINFNNNGAGAVLNHISTAAGDEINNLQFNLSDNLTVNENQTGTVGTPYGLEFGFGEGTSVTGVGNLTINNNNPNGSTFNYGQSVAVYGSVNNAGTLTSAGTGTGEIIFKDTLGSNVTQVIQNSTTSASQFGNGISGSTAITIVNGSLEVDNSSTLTSASSIAVGNTTSSVGAVFRTDGGWTMGDTQTLSGFGSLNLNHSNLISVAGSTIDPGSAGHIGTLTINSGYTQEQLGAGTNLDFTLGSPGNSSMLALDSVFLPSSGLINLDLTDNANADDLGSIGAGTYEIASYNNLNVANAGDITSMFNISGPAGFTYSVSDTAVDNGQIDLTLAAAPVPEPSTWATILGGAAMMLGLRKIGKRRS